MAVSGMVVGSGAHTEMTIDGRCIGPTDDSVRPGSYDPSICGCLRGWAVVGSSVGSSSQASAEASLAAGRGGDVGAAQAHIGVEALPTTEMKAASFWKNGRPDEFEKKMIGAAAWDGGDEGDDGVGKFAAGSCCGCLVLVVAGKTTGLDGPTGHSPSVGFDGKGRWLRAAMVDVDGGSGDSGGASPTMGDDGSVRRQAWAVQRASGGASPAATIAVTLKVDGGSPYRCSAELVCSDYNHSLAQSLDEKGNSFKWIVSSDTTFTFNMSHISRNSTKSTLGFSSAPPPNCDYRTI
ncbi:hypothetical protein ACLOJK_021913 [Asimina triloba]